MKIWIVGGIAALSLIMGVWAQDSQTVARPRKAPAASDTPADSDLPKIPSKLSPKATKGNDAGADATFQAETNVVNVDVQVLDNNGNPIPNIPRNNFRILEDNVPQTLSQFSVGEAPMTVAMVIEFSARYQAYYSSGWAQTLSASYGFIQSLKPEDYVAIIAYDLKSTILSDFTNDRAKTMDAMSRLRLPGFAESNMFDALTDTSDRMAKIEGRKAILLISSGIDTFSKLTYDKTRKNLQEAGVPVYAIEMLQVQRIMADASGGNGNQEITFLQGDNELRTFAKETGGQAFFPRFQGELPNIFRSIAQSLRSQYSLGYSPNNQSKDGKFRKITVQLVNPGTSEPLRMLNEKGKPMKYTILAKAGYKAPRAVE
jgi:VWFA-related protein